MGKLRAVSRVTVVGAAMLLGGASTIVGSLLEGAQGPAFADSSPVEMFCPGTPVGNVVFNNVVMSGSLSPTAPSSGQQFSLDGFQAEVPISPDVVQTAAAIGNTSLSGTVQSTIEVTGATPSSMPTGSLSFDTPIPKPVPSSGLTLSVPASPQSFGPFTASSSNITVALSQEISLTFDDAGSPLDLTCSWYPNDSLAASGETQQTPPGLPITPVVAFAGTGGGAPPALSATGPYELYCPGTPVGNIALNDVVTTGSVSPSTLAAGDQFSLSGYQTQIPIPAGIADGLAGFGNSQLQGYSATTIDAFGGSPSELSTGLESFDVPLPSAGSASGVTLDIPDTASTIGPFVANGGSIAVAGEQTTLMVAAISSHIVNIGCEAYPNDTVTPSGVVKSQPAGSPILPVIATSNASGNSTPPTPPPLTGNPSPITGPYELYCPGSPLGDLVLNNTVTTASISPSDPALAESFDVTGYQTQITVPQAVLQLFEDVGVSSVSGFMEPDVTASGALAEGYGNGGGGVIGVASSSSATVSAVSNIASSGGSVGSASSAPPTTTPLVDLPPVIVEPFPIPGLTNFTVTLPTPLPSSGVTFDVPSPPADLGLDFTALGGPIEIDQQALMLDLRAPGTADYSLFCQAYPNDTEPEGVTTTAPQMAGSPVEIASGSSTLTPPSPPFTSGPYEEFCEGTSIGNVVLNDVTSTGSLSPADPASGQQFQVTGYQTSATLPASVVQTATGIGATSITGTATSSFSLLGATPSTYSGAAASFDLPLSQPVPSSGLQLLIPTTPVDAGPFTATGGTVTILRSPVSTMTVNVGGINESFSCLSYPNNSEPSGFGGPPPTGSPIWPVVASSSSNTDPPAPPSSATTGSSSDPQTEASSDPGGGSGSGSGGAASSDPSGGSSSDPSGGSSSDPSGGSGSSADPNVVTASSGSLAFTGPSSIMGWLAISGAILALMGIGLLVLVDAPRRMARRLLSVLRSQENLGHGPPTPGS